MKKLITLLACAAALAVTTTARAADKEEEIKGEGCCLKCELKKADKCQNAIRVKKDGKEMIYVLEANEVSKAFHSKVCTAVKKVVAKGTVKKEGDKMILTVSKIDLDEKKDETK